MLTHVEAQQKMQRFAKVCEREAEERSRQLKLYFPDEQERSHETARVVVEPEHSDIDGLGWTFSVHPPSERHATLARGCWFLRACDGAVFGLGSGCPLVDQVHAFPLDGGWRDDSQSTEAADWDAG